VTLRAERTVADGATNRASRSMDRAVLADKSIRSSTDGLTANWGVGLRFMQNVL